MPAGEGPAGHREFHDAAGWRRVVVRATGCAWTRPTARRSCRSSSTTPSAAPPRTRCAAPGDVAPGRHQPRRDHPHRPGDRPLRHGQPTFERQTGYHAAAGGGAHRHGPGRVGRPCRTMSAVAAIREHDARCRTCPPSSSTKGGDAVDAGVGARFAMDRRDGLVINARDVTEAERNRLQREAILQTRPSASPSRASSASSSPTRASSRCTAGRQARWSARAGAWSGTAMGLPAHRRPAGPQLARGDAAEIETPARRFDGSSFLARSPANHRPSHPARGGTIWIVEDVTERYQVEQALAQAATRPRPPAAPRAPSWPTPATSCARR